MSSNKKLPEDPSVEALTEQERANLFSKAFADGGEKTKKLG